MHCERVYFFAHPEQPLREVEWIHYGRYLHERMKGKPTQYITGRQEFYGRQFRVSPAVLIPRPETEFLVEAVMKLRPNPTRIVDVGTGSGAIAVILNAIAADISPEALKIARANGASPLVRADLLSCFADETLDVVVSNPPYVPLSDSQTLQREVRDHEPHLALFAGPDGLDLYRRLIPEARRVLKPGGLLALEFGLGQSEALRLLLNGWTNIVITPDLAGIPRVLTCTKTPATVP